MNNLRLLGLTLFLAFFSSCVHSESWQPISKCIEYTKLEPHAHVIKADLNCKQLQLISTEESHGCVTTSDFSKRTGAVIAINGDYFGKNCAPLGLNITRGVRWKSSADKKDRSFIACRSDKHCIIDPRDHLATPQSEWALAVGGLQTYVNGRFVCADSANQGCLKKNGAVKNPRTAIGLDKNGQKLFIVVVEGRLPDFPGMTLDDLSAVFRKLDITEGLNLDGGGSSTMVINGKRINALPAGQREERRVGSHIGIVIND